MSLFGNALGVGKKKAPVIELGDSLDGDKPLSAVVELDDIPEDLRPVIRTLIERYAQNDMQPRNDVIRGTLEKRLFWKGLQDISYNPATLSWEPRVLNGSGDPPPITINIFQQMGMSIAQTFSTVPVCVFMPADADNPDDCRTADAAQPIVDLFNRINEMEPKLAELAYRLYCDPYVACYVRHRKDGERFGWHDEIDTEEQEQEFSPERYACANCQAETPTAQMPMPGMMPAAPPAPTEDEGDEDGQHETFEGIYAASHVSCPGCGGDMDDSNVQPPVMGMRPVETGRRRVANGAEILDIYGALEVSVPSYAKSPQDYSYVTLEGEVDRAILIATYGDKARDTNGDASLDRGRVARLMVNNGGPGADGVRGVTVAAELQTFKRTWMRSWIWETIDEEDVRTKLKSLFPDGCYVAYVGEKLLDARNESIDDVWRFASPTPGDGAVRESLGGSFIPAQKALNELFNLELETHRFGISPIFCDTSLVDDEKLAGTPIKPGSFYPVTLKAGKTISNTMWQPPPASVNEQLIRMRRELANEIGQGLTGALPALAGAEMGGAGETSSGYKQAHDYAMGRIGIPWRAVKTLLAGCNELAVLWFKKSRQEDVHVPGKLDDGTYENTVISLADLKGDVRAFAEVHEDYPISWTDKRKIYEGFLNSQNPFLAGIATNIENLSIFKRLFGIHEFYIEGEDALKQQQNEISVLLKGQPVPQTDPNTGMPLTDPMTGMPLPPKSSVPIDPGWDNDPIHIKAVTDWLASSAGRKAKKANPMGWANVRLHGQEHKDYVQAMQMQAQQAQMQAQAAQQAPQGGPPQ